ncbi:MAG TPA: hypothetical protein PLK77_05110 [Pyrinomonadaceae bacterium]|nr:hypothetical protein [Pyrinomonadaceae bacterium]
MLRLAIALTLFLTLISGAAIAQTTPSGSPSPTPKPQARRPGLDQFGLSNGVFSRSSGDANPDASANAAPVTKEFVDADTFDTITVLIEKSEFMEAELKRVLTREPDVDMSAGSPFTQYFLHNMIGLTFVSLARRDGRIGSPGIKTGQITKLFRDNEGLVYEMSAVLGTSSTQYARSRPRYDAIAEKYGVPLLATPVHGTLLDRPALVRVLMARVNANFARVKKIMTVEQ